MTTKRTALHARALQGVDVSEEPTAGHLPAHLLQGEADAVQVVFDEVAPGENREAFLCLRFNHLARVVGKCGEANRSARKGPIPGPRRSGPSPTRRIWQTRTNLGETNPVGSLIFG